MAWFYLSGRSVIKLNIHAFKPNWNLIKTVALIGIPTAVIQICLALAASLTNMAAKPMADSDQIIAAYGVVQRLILIGSYIIMGFMQGYQPAADVLTILVCLCSVKSMKSTASRNMAAA